MLSRLLTALITLVVAAAAQARPLQQTTVFQQGEGGYHTFRIPAVVQASDGTLLAFAEGRVNGSGDNGNIDIVLKRSFDGGATWGPIQVVHSNGLGKAGNPAPVVDVNTGNIVLPFVLNGQTPAYRVSSDHGATWSAATNIAASAKPATWDGYAFGPVHGIQLQRGPNAGRLVISGNHTLAGEPLSPAGREAHVIYSDDGGVTWQVGGVLKNTSGGINPNESTIVELVDGRIHINTRNQGGSYQRRLIGYSSDGGETFLSPAAVEDQLIDPTVQAALLRYAAVDTGDAVNRILFSNPDSETTRHRMTIKSSFDETLTWDAGKLVYRGPAGYSDMVKTLAGGGILYENGTNAYYSRISFARFDTGWLDDPSLMQIDFRDNTANDQQGNGIHGMLQGNPTLIAGAPNYSSGTATHFDGNNDMIRVADSADHAFDFDETDSFTIEVVFRTTAHGSGGSNGSGPLVAKDVGANTPSFWLRVQDGRLRFFVDDGSSAADVLSPASVNDGDWHHAAAVLDRDADELRLYIDDVLVDTQSGVPTGSLANSNDLLIGAFNNSSPGVRRLLGDLDLVRISMGALDPSAFVQPLPEPGSVALLGVGVLACFSRGANTKRRAA